MWTVDIGCKKSDDIVSFYIVYKLTMVRDGNYFKVIGHQNPHILIKK